MAVSLSADTKDALARDVPPAAHCRQALLRGLALYGCSSRNGFMTQRNAVARLFRVLLQAEQSAADSHIEKVAGTRLLRTPSYRIALPAPLRSVPSKPAHRCDRVSETRAAFLACE